MNDFILFLISYCVVIVGIFVFFNWWSNGFLWAFLRTKAGRGKKVLTIIKGQLDSYPSKGWLEGKKFYYFDRETKKDNENKVPKFIDLDINERSPIVRLFNVPVVHIDEVTGKFVMPDDGSSIGTFDPIQQENFIIRALQKPTLQSNILLIIILIAVIIVLFVGIACLVQIGKIPPLIESLKAINNVVGVNV